MVLDPRFTKTAAKATEWLPVSPGTDLAFFLALLQEIIYSDCMTSSSSRSTRSASRRSRPRVRDYTPEWAATLTEIPAGTIRRIAARICVGGPPLLRPS